MSSRNVRFVNDEERIDVLRDHIKVAAEIVEAFRAAYEDGIHIIPERAVEMLDEAANRLQCAHLDTFNSVDDGSRDQIDIVAR